MKRRTVLGATALLPLAGIGRWLDRLLLVNQGEIVEKRLVASEGGTQREIAVVDADGQAVSSRHEGRFDGAPGTVSAAVEQQLRAQYDDLTYYVTVAHHETSGGQPADGRPVEYETSRVLYSGLDVGDHISFQTSLLRSNAIISLSCHTDSRDSLQRRCRVNVEDPTGEM